MKKFLMLLASILMFSTAYAYEPSITQQVAGNKNLNCKEVVFISGKPVEMEGTLTVSNSGKSSTLA